MIILREKNYSVISDALFYLPYLKNSIGDPKFVIDYIKGPQQILKGGDGMCYWCFPVTLMGDEPEEIRRDKNGYAHYFLTSIGGDERLRLVEKDGKWFEETGIFFKKYTPVIDPAAWMYDFIRNELADEPGCREENMKNSDYKQWEKALESLKKMIGKYKS